VVAAHVPISNRVLRHTKLVPYRSYAMALALEAAQPAALFWDTDNPYHYIRTHERPGGGRALIIGGEDHKTGSDEDTEARFARLEEWSRTRFGRLPVLHRWSGQIIESVDGLPYIGHNSLSSRIYVATAYAGQGMTSGTLAGMIISDLVAGRENPYADLYDATRFKPIASAREYAKQNVAFPAHLVGDRLRRHADPAVSALAPGEGAVLSLHGQRLAVYREPGGELTALSPVCTHLGCLVHWNGVEKSWDCPCHGSRFDPEGNVLNGPAVTPLEARAIPLTPEREEEEAVQALPGTAPEPA
jgi:nitrite reductase/ring-hydroxylating ferredoxin subunit